MVEPAFNEVQNECVEVSPVPTANAGDKLALKEIRAALGETYKPIITLDEAAALSRLSPKTIQNKITQGYFKTSVKRGRPLLFWTDRFIKEVMGGLS